MKIKAFMINVEYIAKVDNQLLPKELIQPSDGSILEILNINFLDERDYEEGTILGDEAREGWVINTHYRGKGKYSKKSFYQIAFRLELDAKQKIEDYFLSVRGTSISQESDILRYSSKYDLFFDTTIFKKEGSVFKRVSTRGIANDSAGRFFLDINSSNERGCCFKSIPIMVLPSSITYNDYIKMVEELIMIREDLVINNNAKISLGNKWDIRKESIERCINNIINPIRYINNNPAATLKSYQIKTQYNKIKKKNSRTLIDRALYPNKNKYLTQLYNEDVDIYENRAIKYALYALKNKVNQYEKRFNYELDENKNYIEKVKSEFKEITKESIYEKRIKIQNKKSKYKQLIKNIKDNEISIHGDISLKFNVFKDEQLKHIYSPKISIKILNNNIFEVSIKSTWDKIRKNYDLDLKYKDYIYNVIGEKEKYLCKFYSRLFDCTLKTTDINQIIFLIKSIEENTDKITIEAKAIRKSKALDDPFGGEIFPGKHYRKFNIELTEIISINGEETICYNDDEIESFLSNYNIGIDENEEDSLGFLDSIIEKENKIHSLQETFTGDSGWSRLENKINNILSLPIFNNVGNEVLPIIKPTQIFINHSSYNQIYYNLITLEKGIKFVDEADSKDILIKSTSDIYEMWCLWKIVDVLVSELRWSIKNKKQVIEAFDEFFSEKNKYKEIPLIIKLQYKLKDNKKLNLEIIYEGRIYYSKRKFKTPDYQFIFQYEYENGEKSEKKRFYLDAKYRNYEKQGEHVLYKDIKEVAIDKYIKPYENTELEPISSFIMHSNEGKKYTTFGGYMTNEDNDLYDYNNIHNYGAFSLTPSNSNNLRKFLKMIIEYHLGLYNYCWNCGEDIKIDRVVKKTKGGNNKYHYKCNTCNEFWVKNHCYNDTEHALIKHIDNYHYINNEKDTPWFVVCPECDGIIYDDFLDMEF